MEKLFYVRPGANPDKIALEVRGAKALRVDQKTGGLVAETDLGDVRFTRPVAYYLDEPEKRIEVSYTVKENTYTFALSNYDRAKTLVIDPLLASTFLGGSGNEIAYALALDSAGNVYVTGWTSSIYFPTTPGAYDKIYNGNVDVFVSKLDGNLSAYYKVYFRIITTGDMDGNGKDEVIVNFDPGYGIRYNNNTWIYLIGK